MTLAILDHTNAPANLWALASKYAIILLNHTANASIGGITPIERAFGITPDISALLQYAFNEPIYYLDTVSNTSSFPSTKEKLGRFVGIAESMGDAMTYYVLTRENKVIARSVMRSALDVENHNLRVLNTINVEELRTNVFNQNNIHHTWDGEIFDDVTDAIPSNDSSSVIQSTQDINGNKPLPVVDPKELIGFNFVLKNKQLCQL